jgi:hypothetical protein
LVAIDFLVVPTATFRVLRVFAMVLHHRRAAVDFQRPQWDPVHRLCPAFAARR